MKKIFYFSSMLLLTFCLSANAQDDSSTIRIKITDENGKLIEKEYKSEEAMQNDPELKELGVDVELRKSGLTLRNREGIQKISVIKEGGSNRMVIHQQGSLSDSSSRRLPPPPPRVIPPPGEEEFAGEHQRMMEMRDSLLSMHKEEIEARREEMLARREEMRLRMEERREEMRKLHNKEERSMSGTNNYMVTIEDLSALDAARLGIKSNRLKLEDLRVKPSPQEETLQLSFSANSKQPVQIKLSNQDNALLLNDTHNLQGKSFEKTYELEGLNKGTYFLQIIQNNKVMGKRIVVE